MQPVKSTIEILAFKVLNRNATDAWVDWAIDMLTAGFDTEHLVILAGETEPFNQFQMQDLTTKVLDELHLDYSDKDKIIKQYVCYLIDRALTGESETFKVLKTLRNLCIELNYEKYLYHFYILYFAKEDLLETDHQWYLEGADKNNIDKIIFDYFIQWKSTC